MKFLLLIQIIAALTGALINHAAPANDAFINATLLAPPPSSVIGTAVDATVEPGEPAIWHTERTVWWYWVANKSGTVGITGVQGPAPFATVFRGTELTNLTFIASGTLYHFLPMVFHVEEGKTYYVRIHAAERIEFRFETGPDNDAFARADQINGRFAQISGDNTLATMEPGEAGEGGVLKSTLWWKWVAPESGRFRLSTKGSDAPVEAWLVQGSLNSFQVFVGAGYGASGVDVVEGETYYIRVASPAFGRGRFVFSLFPPTPINDRFANRIALVGHSGRAIGTTVGATNEPGERLVDATSGSARSTVWWSWTAPADGRFVLNCRTAPLARLNLALYAGTSLRRLSRLAFGHERISAPVFQGRTYAIQVDGVGNFRDDFAFDYELVTAPANDSHSGATPLTGPWVRITNDNTAATLDPGERRLSSDATGATLWYSWVAPQQGWCWLKVEALDQQPVAAMPYARAYKSGINLQPLTMTRQEGYLFGKTGFAVEEGVTYLIAVDTSYKQRGLIALELDLTTLQIAQPGAGSIFSQREPPAFSIPVVDASVDGSLGSGELVMKQDYGPSIHIAFIGGIPAVFQPTNLPSGLNEFFIRATNSEGRERLSPPITLLVRPRHDDFAYSAKVAGYEWRASAPFQGATRESHEPLGGRPSVWFSWSPPAEGTAHVRTSFSGGSGLKLSVFVGDTLESLQRVNLKSEIDRYDGLLDVYFPVTEGVTYRIAATVNSIAARHGFDTSIKGELFTSELSLPAGATFVEGSNVPILVKTTERPDSIQRIEFYKAEEELIGVISNGTTFVWSNVPCGVHYIKAAIRKFGDIQPPRTYGQRLTVKPHNDNFTSAAFIDSFPATVRSCTSSATRETGEPMHSGYILTGSTWWRFIAPANGRLLVRRSGAVDHFQPDPYFALYTGDSLERLTLVATNGEPQIGSDDLSADLIAGTTYHLATSSSDELRLRFFSPPANDNFTRSIEITDTNTTVRSHTVLATLEPGEPFYPQYATNTVWWHWVAPTNGFIQLELLSTSMTTWLAVYEGERVDQLLPVSPLTGGRWIVRPGHTYRIAVASYWFASAEDVSVHLQYRPVATNDMFSSAITVFGESVTFDANTIGATAEPGESTPLNAAGTSLWWRWTAPRSGTVRIQGDGVPGGGLVFEVFIGDSLDTLMPVTFFERFFRRQQFNAVEGQSYYILLDSVVDFPAADGVELFFEPPRL